MKLPKTFASLGFRNYRLLWFSSALANSGQYAFTVAASWLIFSLSHSTALVGSCMFASMIPGVVFGPIIGVLVDRYDRRFMLSIALFFNVCNTGCLALLSSTGVISPWVIIVSAFFLGISNNLQITCTNSMIPDLIPKSALFNATALQGTIQHGSGFIGSALASPLLVFGGPVAVFTICCLLYIGAGIQSLWITTNQTRRQHGTESMGNLFRPVVEGLVYIRINRYLGLLVIMVGFHCLLTMAYTSMLPQFIRDDLAASSGIYGTLMMFIGLGAIIGNLCTATISTPRGQGILYIIMALASGFSLVILGLAHTALFAFIVGLTVGASQAVFMAINLSFLLKHANDEYRGRVTSVNFIIASGAMAVGNFLFGVISKYVPPRISMVSGGSGFVILVIGLLLISPTLRSFYNKEKQVSGIPQ